MQKPTELWLVRHGETEWSRSGQHTGRTDIPLLEEGRRMAERLAPILAEHAFEAVLTSPLSRARETCALAGFGDRAQARDDLMEWDYGEYEGKTTAEIRVGRADWSLWREGVLGGESAEQVGARAGRIIAEAAAASGDVLAFAHGHVLRVLAAVWLQLPPSSGKLFSLSTATVSRLGCERDQPVVLSWNRPSV